MIKVLIISYHFPPDNIIAARRSEAYARHFHKFGIFPTIVTDRLEKAFDNDGNWIGYKNHERSEKPIKEEYKTHMVIRLPRHNTKLQNFQRWIERFRLLSPIFSFILHVLGHFDMHLLSHHANYKSFLSKHLKNNSYNMILAIDSPHFHVKLAHLFNKNFSIPYICDFRDLYDNSIMNPHYRPSFSRKTINWFKVFYLKRWLSNCMFLTVATKPWAEFYESKFRKKAFEVTNGFEEKLFVNSHVKSNKEFWLSHTGRLYNEQDWDIFIEGFTLFLNKRIDNDIKLVFAGVRSDAAKIIDLFKAKIPNSLLVVKSWIAKNDVFELQKSSSILFTSPMLSAYGHYPGKIFEYLGARKPILFAPGDNDGVVDRLLKRTRAGISANTPQEVCTFITEKYNEWKQTGRVSYNGTEEEIMKYTRENQVKKMAELIHNFLPAKSNR